MYLQFFQSETATSTQFSVITDGGASDYRAEGTGSRTRENFLGFLNAVITPADFAGGLVEPSLNMTLPPLVEVSIWNHIISLTHFCCLVCNYFKKQTKNTQ